MCMLLTRDIQIFLMHDNASNQHAHMHVCISIQVDACTYETNPLLLTYASVVIVILGRQILAYAK